MTHLVIENQNSNVEIVNAAIILKLYEMALSAEGDVSLKGNLLSDHAKLTAYDYLTGNLPDSNSKRFPNLTINIPLGGLYIDFADPEVERILKANNIGDGVGVSELNMQNVTTATGIPAFTSNTTIEYFDEFKKFGVSTINGNYAMFLGCTNLKTIDISNITTINDNNVSQGMFRGCTNLTSVGNTSNLQSIGSRAFAECPSLASINLSNVTYIGFSAFIGCSSLTSVDISNCTSFSSSGYLFYGCSGLLSIGSLNSAITSLPPYTFYNCTSLTSIDLSNCILFKEFALGGSGITSVDLSSCTSIDTNAFRNCTNLTSVLLPSSAVSISATAFTADTSLTTIDLSNVTSIGNEAFNWCSGLTSVNISSCTSLGFSVFKNCTGLTSVTLSSSITSIPKGMFYGCTSLSSIDLSNVTSIDGDYNNGAFKGCTSLTTLNLSNVRHFGRECFSGCTSLGSNLDLEVTTTDTTWAELFMGTAYKSVTVHGANLTALSASGTYPAFRNMPNVTTIDLSDTALVRVPTLNNTSLETIIVPPSVNYMTYDSWNFINNNNFKYFILLATTPPSYENVGYCKLKNGNFYVPDDYVATYKAAWPLISGYQNWNIHDHILPLSLLPVGVWKTGLYQQYEPYLSNSTDPAYS